MLKTDSLPRELQEKHQRLADRLAELKQCIVAFSGGVDSALLAAAAHDVLGDKAIAVIAQSPSLPVRELRIAQEVAAQVGIELIAVKTYELDNPSYTANAGDRCYFCKDELFETIEKVMEETGIEWVAYGENLDDLGDYRPGQTAAKEHGVRAPLREVGLTKEDVRALAKAFELPVWNKPAFACLSSRFPVGTKITGDLLQQVETSEDVLWSLGFRQFRVRHHGDIARIEVPKEDLSRLVEVGDQVVTALRQAGYKFVTMDLAGFRSGGLNVLPAKQGAGNGTTG